MSFERIDLEKKGKELEAQKKDKSSPTYTTVLHRVRKEFGLTMIDYCVADYIHKKGKGEYSRDIGGYVVSSKETIAKALQVSRISVIRAINKLVERELLEKQPTTKHLRTSLLWSRKVDFEEEELDRRRRKRYG